MVTLFLILSDLFGVGLFIYLFDYRVDGIINKPIIVIIGVLIGFIIAIIAAFLYLEATYLIFHKKPQTDFKKHVIGKGIVRVLLDIFRIKIEVKGIENLPKQSNFIIYSNHTSELDIPIIMISLKEYPVAFLSKQDIRNYPSVGKWAESIGCVFLDRQDNKQGLYAINDVIEKVKNGLVMTIFPEGTFVRGKTELLKFRSGAFKVALEGNVPIVPITLVKAANFKKVIWPFKKLYTVVIHPSILFEEIVNLKTSELSLKVKEIINSKLVN